VPSQEPEELAAPEVAHFAHHTTPDRAAEIMRALRLARAAREVYDGPRGRLARYYTRTELRTSSTSALEQRLLSVRTQEALGLTGRSAALLASDVRRWTPRDGFNVPSFSEFCVMMQARPAPRPRPSAPCGLRTGAS